MESLRKQATRILREQKKYKLWLAAFLCLAVLVTAGTVAALTMSGQALNRKEKVLTCQLEVHQHTEECRDSEGNLVCGQADYVVHVHNDDCYKDGELVCTLPEVEPHTHTEECFQEQKTLVCGFEENEGHVHDENCYAKMRGDLICGKEGTGHQHGPECYTKVQGELICASGEEGHEHTDECYTWSEKLTCGQIEEVHGHTEECYAWKEELTCQIADGEEAHKHTEECYAAETVNICGKLELHTHEESCYEEDENGAKRLVCGQTELLEHVHGEDCFEIIEPDVAEESKEASEDAEGTEESAEGAEESSEADGEEEPVQGVAGVLTAEGSDYTVTATFGEDAGIPEGTQLNIEEIPEDLEEYEKYCQEVLTAISGDPTEGEEPDSIEPMELAFARFFHISFVTEEGEEVEPKTSVETEISYQTPVAISENGKASAACIAEDGALDLSGTVEETEDGTGFGFVRNGASVLATVVAEELYPNGRRTLTAEGEDYSVTVSFGVEANVPAGAQLSVEEILEGTPEFEECYQEMLEAIAKEELGAESNETELKDKIQVSFIRFFDISFLVDGEKIEPEAPVDIRISYKNELVVGDNETASAVHFAQEGTEVLDAQVVEAEEGSDFEFTQSSFSKTGSAVYSMTSQAGASQAAEVIINPSIMEGQKITGHNDWQIVVEGYDEEIGNENKEPISGHSDVRVQKSVIPTDIENEFLVYLSIDIRASLNSLFTPEIFKALVHEQNTEIGEITNNSNFVAIRLSEDPAEMEAIKKDASKWDDVILKSPDGNETVFDGVIGWGNTFGEGGANGKNISLVLHVDNKYYAVGQLPGNMGKKGKVERTLGQDAYNAIKKDVVKSISLTNVEDKMGEHITCEEIIKGDYDTKPTPGDVFTWIPKVKENPKTYIVPGDAANEKYVWGLNVAELLYRVKLHVEDKGFHSCADNMQSSPDTFGDNGVDVPESYPVNEYARLTYQNGTVDFPIPQVRGLLYDLTVEKKDADDNTPLYGAKFKLKDSKGNIVQVKNEDGSMTDLEVITDRDGKATFSSLPWGNTYTLVETQAPEGYQPIQETNGKTVRDGILLCYTDDMHDNGQLDSIKMEAKTDGSGFGPNMKYKEPILDEAGQITGEKPSITVTNEKIPLRIVKVWDDESYEDRPYNVTFSIYYDALDYGEDGNPIKTKTLYRQLELKGGEDVKEGEDYIAKHVTTSADDRWVWNVENIPASANYYVKEEKVGDQSIGDSCIYEIDKRKNIYWEDAERDEIYDDNGKIVCSQYTITNRLKNRPVTIIKKDKDSGQTLPGASFKLYAEDPSQNGQAESIWKADGNEEGIKVTDAKGKIDAGELKKGTYYLVEEEPPEGYKKIDEPIVVMVTPGTDTYEVEVENELDELPVEIWKVDSSDTDKGLLNAVFTVKKWNDEEKVYENYKEGEWKSKTAEDGTLGLLYEGKLPAGTYMLTEIDPPDGYNTPNNDFVFTIGNEVTKEGDVPNLIIENVTNDKGGTILGRIKILNDAGAILPETGGNGTILYTLGGMMLVSVTALLMYGYSVRRKKSERRVKQ